MENRLDESTKSGTREHLIMTNHTHNNTSSHHQQLSSSQPNIPPLTPPSDLPLNASAPHTHVRSHFKHTDTCTHPGAHLLSKSRKKCGQFSKSLPRTLMRFPMAGDLDGRKQQNAYSTQNLATQIKIHKCTWRTQQVMSVSFSYPSVLP